MTTSRTRQGDSTFDASRYYVLPASFGQERLWFLTQLEGGADATYNIHATVMLTGELDRVALQRALDHVLAKQESLRSGVALIDETVRQIVLPTATVTIPRVDRGGLDREQREAELRRTIIAEAMRPFVLEDPPLVRFTLVKLSDVEHALIVVLHHSIADGWSINLLLRELATAYITITQGLDVAALPAPSIQYADYAAWQREQLTDERIAAKVAHWRDRLTGVPPLELPTDQPRAGRRSTSGAICHAHLDSDTVAALDGLGKSAGTTLFMTLLASFEVLLSRISGQTDFAVGTAVANRTIDDVRGLIGLFANTLALRADLSDNPTFLELLDRVRGACLDAYDHQDLPFERLVEALRPVRDLSRTPLFQVMFVLQDDVADVAIPGLAMSRPLEFDIGAAKFDLSMSATRTDQGLSVTLGYSTDLFDRRTAELFLDYLRQIVGAVAADPRRRVGEIRLTADRTVASPAAVASAPLPVGRCVPEFVDAAAAATPTALAVADERSAVDYATLRDRARHLAVVLADAGVRPGEHVAICLPRSLDLVVAILAVWQAGAAYVPVDPALPGARIAHMLDDANVRTVLTVSASAALPGVADRRTILLEDQRFGGEPPVDRELPGPGLDRAAYLIYTSGSTGTPKGVAVSHRNLAHHLEAMRTRLECGRHDTLVAVTSVSFDISGLELFLPLVSGGRTVVAGAETVVEGTRLAELLGTAGATITQGTPATWRLLLDAGWTPPAGFRVLCGGEALDAELGGRLVATGAQVWNLYGPTETTIWASAAVVTDPGRIRLGDPLPGISRHLLDDRLEPVPPGVVGELYLGGPLVATGYHNSPRMTAARFLPDPFPPAPTARLYRTGDLCRYTVDGELQFLGRADDQVKIRGFRVEPTEIEAVLASVDGVAQVAVVASEIAEDDVRLVAHVVPSAERSMVDATTMVARIRAAAAHQLPGYAVPAMVHLVDEMPLTPAGKVDRRTLRELGRQVAAGMGDDDTPPRTDSERVIAALFADVLGARSVGVFASFFELGGHSLLAAKLMSRIHVEFGVVVPIRALFENPTVAAVAAAIETARFEDDARASSTSRELVAQLSDTEVEELLRQLTGPVEPA